MKNSSFFNLRKISFKDPVYYYIFTAACMVFFHISLEPYVHVYYQYTFIIPCMMFLGAMLERKEAPVYTKRFVLPGIMAVWFLLLQGKRGIDAELIADIGLFLSVYLFAFPLASLLQDGETKKGLTLFALAYLAACALLSLYGLLLYLDCLPVFLTENIFWDGTRLCTIWHPNITGCLFMIGIILGSTFLMSTKSLPSKIALSVLLVIMTGALALTSSRTSIILTGGYLGSVLFFAMIRRGKKWFIPGILAVAVVIVIFYMGSTRFYQFNSDRLIQKFTQQYIGQITATASDGSQSEEEKYIEAQDAEMPEDQTPIRIDPETGDVILTTDSPQGTLANDLGTFNSRSIIWNSALQAIRETPTILLWGVPDPGWHVASYYPHHPIAHLHNAWLQCLVGMGLVGFVVAILFSLVTVWNCTLILLKHYRDIWKRNTAILALCLLTASILEPYLFYTTSTYHMINFLFFLCSGYLAHWQEADNHCIFDWIRSRTSLLKKH